MSTMVLIFALIAVAPDDTFERGRELFDKTYFEQACPLLQSFVQDPADAPEAKVVHGRWLLAQCQFFTGDVASAKAGVVALLKRHGEPGDAGDWPPDFKRFVEAAQPVPAPAPAPTPAPPSAPVVRVKPKATPRPAPKPRPAEVVIVAAPVSQPASAAAAVTALLPPPRLTPWYVRGLPAGIGHFILGDPVGGAIFASLGVATLSANITLAVLSGRKLRPDGTFPAGNLPLYVMQHVTAGLFYATLIASIVDGIWFAPARVRPSVAPLADGGSLILSGSW